MSVLSESGLMAGHASDPWCVPVAWAGSVYLSLEASKYEQMVNARQLTCLRRLLLAKRRLFRRRKSASRAAGYGLTEWRQDKLTADPRHPQTEGWMPKPAG